MFKIRFLKRLVSCIMLPLDRGNKCVEMIWWGLRNQNRFEMFISKPNSLHHYKYWTVPIVFDCSYIAPIHQSTSKNTL